MRRLRIFKSCISSNKWNNQFFWFSYKKLKANFQNVLTWPTFLIFWDNLNGYFYMQKYSYEFELRFYYLLLNVVLSSSLPLLCLAMCIYLDGYQKLLLDGKNQVNSIQVSASSIYRQKTCYDFQIMFVQQGSNQTCFYSWPLDNLRHKCFITNENKER